MEQPENRSLLILKKILNRLQRKLDKMSEPPEFDRLLPFVIGIACSGIMPLLEI
jgi:vacuolar-type H+-ATPase subunit E/Vma4